MNYSRILFSIQILKKASVNLFTQLEQFKAIFCDIIQFLLLAMIPQRGKKNPKILMQNKNHKNQQSLNEIIALTYHSKCRIWYLSFFFLLSIHENRRNYLLFLNFAEGIIETFSHSKYVTFQTFFLKKVSFLHS